MGQTVHYVAHGTPIRPDGTQAFPSVCRAAIVTEVSPGFESDGLVSLCVLNPTGQFFSQAVPYDEGSGPGGPIPPGGTWHRVEPV